MKTILTLLFLTLSIFLFAQTPANWYSKGIGGGGALFAPSINPTNHNELSISCDMSPLFQSGDKGLNWTTTPFKKISAGHASKMIYTNNALIRYCISYPSVNGFDYYIPVKTIDGGNTWTQLAGNPDSSEQVYFLDADFNNPDRVIMNYYNQIYFSSNGGATFNLIHTATNPGAGVHVTDVLWDGNNIYIGMIDGVLQSTNGGTSFAMSSLTGIATGEKILSFASGKEGSNIRFFAITADAGDIYTGMPYGSNYAGIPKAIYRADNATGAWTLITNINFVNFPLQFPVIVAMAKNDIDTVYAGGGTTNGSGPCLFRHVGSAWTSIFNTASNQNIQTGWCGETGDLNWSWAESLFGMQVAPNNSNQIIITDWGFAHVSDNGGILWTQIYTDTSGQHPANTATPKGAWYKGNGLENTSCWDICWRDSNFILSGYSDITGMKSNNKGTKWRRIPNIIENSVYDIIKADDGILYAATSSIHDMYQSTYLQDSKIDGGNGRIYFSIDSGNTFLPLTDLGAFKPVMSLVIDPTNVNRMYAAVAHSTAGGIYKTNNLNLGIASTWNKVTNPPRTQGHAFNIKVLKNGDLVASYSGRRNSSGIFTPSSGVFYSSNQGSTWSDRSDSGMHYWTKDVIIDPHDTTQSTWYATVFSGWNGPLANNTGGGIYKTTNKGLNWTKISNEYRVNSLTIHPSNTNECYATTETNGLLYCNNINTSSPTFSSVTNFPFRHPVRVFFNPHNENDIWVTTFGNGVYNNSTITPNNLTSIRTTYDIELFPNPSHDFFHLNIPKEILNSSLKIYNVLGELMYTQHHITEKNSIDFSMQSPGLYFVQIIHNDKIIGSKKLLLE